MAKQRNIGLTQNGLLTEEAVRCYMEGSLSEEQRKEFEAILASDPFAQDAIEGMKASASVSQGFSSVEEIKTNIRNRTGLAKANTKSLQVHWSVFAYAAALVAIVVGVGVIFMFYQQQPKTELAMVETVNQDSIDASLEANMPIQDTTTLPATVANDTAGTSTLAADNTLAAEVVNEATKQAVSTPATATMADERAAGAIAAAPVQATYKDDKATMDRFKAADVSTAPAASAKKAVAEEKEAVPQTEIAQGMSLFTNGDYKNAETKFNEVLAKSPDNADAAYFGGVSTYINGNTAKAEQQFDKLLRRGVYVEGSKWYKANILLKKGKTAEAKELLQSLTKTTGVYHDRAVKKLEALQ
jgi:tetratricopeptide (TPR) repeat protein